MLHSIRKISMTKKPILKIGKIKMIASRIFMIVIFNYLCVISNVTD